MKEIYEMTK